MTLCLFFLTYRSLFLYSELAKKILSNAVSYILWQHTKVMCEKKHLRHLEVTEREWRVDMA